MDVVKKIKRYYFKYLLLLFNKKIVLFHKIVSNSLLLEFSTVWMKTIFLNRLNH